MTEGKRKHWLGLMQNIGCTVQSMLMLYALCHAMHTHTQCAPSHCILHTVDGTLHRDCTGGRGRWEKESEKFVSTINRRTSYIATDFYRFTLSSVRKHIEIHVHILCGATFKHDQVNTIACYCYNGCVRVHWIRMCEENKRRSFTPRVSSLKMHGNFRVHFRQAGIFRIFFSTPLSLSLICPCLSISMSLPLCPFVPPAMVPWCIAKLCMRR